MNKGESDLNQLLANMQPFLNEGIYVFTSVKQIPDIPEEEIICTMKENEGTTIVLTKDKADQLKLPYDFIAAWITLSVHSDLSAVGLTAAFSQALAKEGISCNVIAGYYHDHIFVEESAGLKALEILKNIK